MAKNAKGRSWWFSTERMTFGCTTDKNNKIIEVAPVAGWSIGRHVKVLVGWLRKQGGFRYAEYK